jgi:hypothetical protein
LLAITDFFTGFFQFSKKIQNLFSPELDLRLSKLNLISSNDRGDYKRLLFWSYEIKFENFGITPSKRPKRHEAKGARGRRGKRPKRLEVKEAEAEAARARARDRR